MRVLGTLAEVREYLSSKFPSATIVVDEELCPAGVYKYSRSANFVDDLACVEFDVQEAIEHGYTMDEVEVILTRDNNHNYYLRVELAPFIDGIEMEQ